MLYYGWIPNFLGRHIKRVFGYARASDYAVGGAAAAASPLAFWLMEKFSPSHVGKGGFAPVMRLATAIGILGGVHIFYQRSISMLPYRWTYFDISNNRYNRPLLRLHRKHTRGRKGYARNGRQGQEGRATLRQITTLRIPPRRRCPQLAIHRSLCPRYSMVQCG